MPDLPSAEMLKKMRLEAESASDVTAPDSRTSSTVPPKRVTTVHDEVDADNAESEEVTFAPGNDADYFVEEDEEGRFFGGGLTAEQKEILNIFDSAGADQVPDDVRGRTYSLLSTQRQFLVFASLKHSPPLASKSYCYGWREPPTRTRCNDRNIRTIQQSESYCHFVCSCCHYSSAQIH